jgi:hypothetical protein
MGIAYAKVQIETTTVKIRVRATDTPEGAYHRAQCKALRDNLANKRTESWNQYTYYMVASGDDGPVYWAEDIEQQAENMRDIERAIVRAST